MNDKTFKNIVRILLVLLLLWLVYSAISYSVRQYRTRVAVEQLLELLPPPQF